MFPPLAGSSYLASIDAILRDHDDTLIDRAQLPLLFNISGKGKQLVGATVQDHPDTVIGHAQLSLPFKISGKGKQPVRARRARMRAVRGVTAPQHSNCYTPPLKLLLISETV